MCELMCDGEIGSKSFLHGRWRTLHSSHCPNGWSKMGEESRTTLRPSAGREMEGSVFSNDPLEMKQTQQVTQLGNW